MRAIVVDDEPLMLKRFARLSAGIPDLNIAGKFESARDALDYFRGDPVELAFLDVAMPVTDGMQLARMLRAVRPDVMIVFVSAYDRYVWDSNRVGGDYYLLKPYNEQMLRMVMERIRLIAGRQKKRAYIRTFGRFSVLRGGKPIRLTGKAKEILALTVTRRGREISNGEIYNTVWEGRPYDNVSMTVFYNALRRLRDSLEKEGLSDLLISTPRGQMVDTSLFDCDYYSWQDGDGELGERFAGEFMSEYSWGEVILADIVGTETEK